MRHIRMLLKQNSLNFLREFDRLYVVVGGDTGDLYGFYSVIGGIP